MSSRKPDDETPMLDLVAQLVAAPEEEAAPREDAATSDGSTEDAQGSSDGDDAGAPVSTAAMETAVDALMAEAGVADTGGPAFVDEDLEDDAPSDSVAQPTAEAEATPASAQTPAASSEEGAVATAEPAPAAAASEPKPQGGGRLKATPAKVSGAEAPDETGIRILLRQHVLELADELESGQIGRRTAARRLREISEDDAHALDLDDIEVDFDAAPEDHAGMSLLAGLGMPKGARRAEDPIEAALLAAIKHRDRVSALRIVGDTPGSSDRDAYTDALRALRDALNTHLAD